MLKIAFQRAVRKDDRYGMISCNSLSVITIPQPFFGSLSHSGYQLIYKHIYVGDIAYSLTCNGHLAVRVTEATVTVYESGFCDMI